MTVRARILPGAGLGPLFAVVVTAAAALGAVTPGSQPAQGTAAGLFYEVEGTGEPVVLIHAFSVDRRMWDPQVAALRGRFRVIRYDLRGHGRSAAPEAPYTGFGDLLAVLDALDVRRAALVGLSAGAVVATDFALTHPDRVTRLVLAAPGLGGYRVPPLPWAGPVFAAAAAGDAAGAAKLWAGTPIMALRRNTGAAKAVTEMVTGNARLWGLARTERPLDPPALGRLGDIRAPALILVGEQDLPHIREIAGLLAAGISTATLVTIPGAGHIVNLDAPDAFNDAVAAFLGRP